ncbi:hypothetical protein E2562_019779 [Oryza meyeriana var. granulata]|uniref:DUF834 domain-containing protein n=1 Tax=Oryza meyeriana var. granulata TaxID=110450 RepID=A0A6G1DJH0_9ORYZ|nr:hypothetical protein E2562_019779 [Oryza meyeriana var. granulata]
MRRLPREANGGVVGGDGVEGGGGGGDERRGVFRGRVERRWGRWRRGRSGVDAEEAPPRQRRWDGGGGGGAGGRHSSGSGINTATEHLFATGPVSFLPPGRAPAGEDP